MTKEECEIETSKAIMEMRNHIAELEKVIAQLETEKAELKIEKIPQLERKIASIRGAHSVDCKKLNARTEQVERLKKENAELKDHNRFLSNLIQAERERQAQCDYIHLRKIAELKKENTELKELLDCKHCCELEGGVRMTGVDLNIYEKVCEERDKLEEQLTKAKSHIHRLLVLLTEGKRSYAVIDEARAFMKEVSE